MRTSSLIVTASLCGVLVAACSPEAEVVSTTPPPAAAAPVRVVLVGDIMLGRGIAGAMESDPDALFAGVRHLVNSADLTAANLESPLTTQPAEAPVENVLIADPAGAAVLHQAGFDVMSLPNNHAGDAGSGGVLDTIAAVNAAGMRMVGAGSDRAAAEAPVVVEAGGLQIGLLAFDATGVALGAADGPGVALWDDRAGTEAVAALRPDVDLLIVSVHGGTEYLRTSDPGMVEIGAAVVAAGADIVWGHGAHVIQPITASPGQRPAVIATSLGNFLFDQSGRDRTTGALLEVMADAAGVIAYRVGITEHPDRRVRFVEWDLPTGDAAWLDGSWWSLLRVPLLATAAEAPPDSFRHGDLVAAARGDVTGDGVDHVVASFRRPLVETEYMRLRPEVQWADAAGRSAHLGVYTAEELTEVWVAGSVLMPVAALVVCTGSLALAHDSLDDGTIVGTGAWTWNGFGFETAPDLPGRGTPGCGDVDGDGTLDPVIVNRG